jgi:hypothetical protein
VTTAGASGASPTAATIPRRGPTLSAVIARSMIRIEFLSGAQDFDFVVATVLWLAATKMARAAQLSWVHPAGDADRVLGRGAAVALVWRVRPPMRT